jgi:hypothetical protein
MSEEAPIAGREPVEAPPIKANFHISNVQGIQVPESLLPKGEDGKPLLTPAVDERQLETYRKFGVGEDVIKQVAERHPVSETEYRLAQHKLASLKGDPSFVRKYLDGGVEERRIMMTLSVILGSIRKEKNG